MLVLISLAIWLLAITLVITVHEFSHAFAADKLGDPTPSINDRLSLNPLDHYDQVGTTLLIVTSVLYVVSGIGFPFGWAKPVPFDPYNLQNPKRDAALIALAGPLSNLIMAAIASFLLRYFLMEIFIVNQIFTAFITLNVSLALFNLVPVHPLDGGKILMGILPTDMAIEYETLMRRYGFLLLIFLVMPFGGTSPIFALISPIISFLLNLFLP